MRYRYRRILILAALAGLTPGARAHAPGVLRADQAFVVPDATISRALYGSFERGDEVFVVKMSLPRDFAMPVEVFVPHRDELREHRPAWAIVGPGLPMPRDDERAALPRALPAGAGAIVDLNQVAPRPVFYESFTRRFFWSTGTTAIVVPEGDHEIWMWSPKQTRGKFGLGFGVEERLDFGEVFEDWGTYAY